MRTFAVIGRSQARIMAACTGHRGTKATGIPDSQGSVALSSGQVGTSVARKTTGMRAARRIEGIIRAYDIG